MLLVYFMALILLSSFGYAQSKDSHKDSMESNIKEVIAKFDKNYHDFGQVYQGGNGEAVFEIENQGGGLLQINSVKTSCGCLVVDYSHQGLMHKEKGFVRVSYNTNIIGEIKRSVVVNTNDKENPKIILRLVGEVISKQ